MSSSPSPPARVMPGPRVPTSIVSASGPPSTVYGPAAVYPASTTRLSRPASPDTAPLSDGVASMRSSPGPPLTVSVLSPAPPMSSSSPGPRSTISGSGPTVTTVSSPSAVSTRIAVTPVKGQPVGGQPATALRSSSNVTAPSSRMMTSRSGAESPR